MYHVQILFFRTYIVIRRNSHLIASALQKIHEKEKQGTALMTDTLESLLLCSSTLSSALLARAEHSYLLLEPLLGKLVVFILRTFSLPAFCFWSAGRHPVCCPASVSSSCGLACSSSFSSLLPWVHVWRAQILSPSASELNIVGVCFLSLVATKDFLVLTVPCGPSDWHPWGSPTASEIYLSRSPKGIYKEGLLVCCDFQWVPHRLDPSCRKRRILRGAVPIVNNIFH